MLDSFPSPADLGAPSRYTDWRDQQLDAWSAIRSSPVRFRVANLPTGSGKQLLAYMLAITAADNGERTLILTESRGLQSQYVDAFRDARIPLVDIRGAENYRCPALEPGGKYAYLRRGNAEPNASQGPCNSGMPCKLKENGCPRFDALRAAQSAPIVISNYAYWLATGTTAEQQGTDEVLGDFDWIIADEMHAVRSAVSRALSVTVNLNTLSADLGVKRAPTGDEIKEWSAWARTVAACAEQEQKVLRAAIKRARDGSSAGTLREFLDRARHIRRHIRSLDRIATARGEWVVDVWRNGLVKFDVVWPAAYCESMLYRGVPNVVGMSATVSRDSLKYVGIDIDNDEQFDYFEYPSTFPVENRPVYIVPVAKVQWNMSVDDERRWLAAHDAILTSRGDRKALVHPVSYDRTRKILERSIHRDRMVTSSGGKETADAVERFKASDRQDLVFVHPGISTGYDFPDVAAELQIISKIPFADSRNKLVKAWKKSDPKFIYLMAMEYISQTVGRPVRSETDRAETFIVDSHALWFLSRAGEYAKYAPDHFWDSVKVLRGGMLPRAPKRIGGDGMR